MPGRAGPSRSQRQSQPSQRQRDDDSEDEDSDDAVNPLNEDDGGANVEDHLDKRARDLVRLALFNEHRRVPLRREDINKKVLGTYTRAFNTVLAKAQVLLRKTFGMELVELQARNYRDHDPTEDLQNATGVKKKVTAAGSKTYILRSTLDASIIEQAALSDERLLEEEIAQGPDDDDDEDMPRNYGSILSWSTADQLGVLGLLYVILALILVNGRVISEVDLRANLKRLRIPQNGAVPSNAQSTHRSMPIDTFLQYLIRQGYLDHERLGETKSATGKRRGRVSATQINGTDENAQAYEWRWGNRAHSEIGEQAVGLFVGEFMVERAQVGDGDEEEAGGRRRGKKAMEKQLETMVKAIERAAGGNLNDVK